MRIHKVLICLLVFVSFQSFAQTNSTITVNNINVEGCLTPVESLPQDVCGDVNINVDGITQFVFAKPKFEDVDTVKLSNKGNDTWESYDIYGFKDSNFAFGASVFGKLNNGATVIESIRKNPPLNDSGNPKANKQWPTKSLVPVNPEQVKYLTSVEDGLVNLMNGYEDKNGKCNGDFEVHFGEKQPKQFETDEQAKAYLDDIDRQMANFEICNKENKPLSTTTPIKNEETTVDCGPGLADLFHDDNAYKIDSTKNTSQLDGCINKIPENATIVSVDIKSSASRLNNTGDTAKLCGVNGPDGGFLELSRRRSEAMKSYVQSEYLEHSKKTIPDEVCHLNYTGSNGDGSSGDVDPYSGHKSLDLPYMSKPQYASAYGVSIDKVPEVVGSKRAELDKNKYVTVQITYKVPVVEVLPTPRFEIECKPLELHCIGLAKTPGGSSSTTVYLPDHNEVGSGGTCSCAAYH